MEKKKKGNNSRPNQGPQRGRGGGGGNRGMSRGNYNNRGNNRGGNMRSRGGGMNNYNNRNNYNNYYNNYNNYNNRNNNNNNNNNMRRGGGAPYRRFQQNGVRGGFVQKRYNNAPIKTNLRRSRSSMSLNRNSYNNNNNNNRGLSVPRNSFSPHRGSGDYGNSFGGTYGSGYVGGFGGGGGGGGGRFRQSRSRSRTNLNYQNNSYSSPTESFLQRTNSLPDLRDESSVYDRLGYQTQVQAAYRNRVKKTRNNPIMNYINTVNQRQSKNLKMQNALQLSPSGKSLPPLRQRRYSSGSVRSEQLMRAQKRAHYEAKLMRMNASRVNTAPLDYMSSLNEYVQQHPSLSNLYNKPQNTRQLRAKSPFTQSVNNFQTIVPKTKFVNRFAGANKFAKAAAAEARQIKVAIARQEYQSHQQRVNQSRRRSRGPGVQRSHVQRVQKFRRHRAYSP